MVNQDNNAGSPVPADAIPNPARANRRQRGRWAGALLYVILLGLVFGKSLVSLFGYAAETRLFSYILSIPFCSAFLIWNRRSELPKLHHSSPAWALVPLVFGIAAWYAASGPGGDAGAVSRGNQHSLRAFSFVCFLTAGGFLFLGRRWMAASAFPVAFLFFIVPLPGVALQWIETSLQLASAEAADLLFAISGTPVLRDGIFFDLPGFTMQVAQECSGVQATWVLFVSTVLASYLFLKNPRRRAALVAAVIPLGIIRNGFRIVIIGLLCIHSGPHMIHSAIHRQGGPLFLILSLIPLSLFLWWLRKGEIRRETSARTAVATRGASAIQEGEKS